MKIIFFSALLLLLAHFSRSVKVFTSNLDLETPEEDRFLTGAKLINNRGNISVRSITLCCRFNFKILASGGQQFSRVVRIKKPTDESSLFSLSATYPSSTFVFGSTRAHGYYGTFILSDPILGVFNIFDTNVWVHICFVFDAEQSIIRLYKDGYPTNLNHYEPSLSKVQLPRDFLNDVYLLRCTEDNPACSTREGQITDLNIWSKPLSEEEIKDWTSCKLFTKGDLVNWDSATFETWNMSVREEPVENLCRPLEPGSVLFPEKRTFQQLHQLCRMMGGESTVVKSQEQQDQLLEGYFKHRSSCYEGDNIPKMWVGWWDDLSEGEITNVNTGQPLKGFAPWLPGSPNGDTLQNCMSVRAYYNMWGDDQCWRTYCGYCDLERSPQLQLRGLCPNSKFDIQYTWPNLLFNERHYFRGYTASQITWDADNSMWSMDIYFGKDKGVTRGITNGTEYPLGTKLWKIEGDDDSCGDQIMELSLTSCSDDEFNCQDGHCIDIMSRCDGRLDCPDKTDEIACDIFKTDEAYLKDVPPPPPVQSSYLSPINISVDILSVLGIYEVRGLVRLQLQLDLSWFDERLTMFNLKDSNNLNTLTLEERRKIWIPQVVFFNTVDKLESENDNKAFVVIRREGSFVRSDKSIIENAYIYQGKENPLIISRSYTSEFLCDFNMAVYPFDTQICSVIVIMKGNTGEFTQLIVDKLTYLGPIDLTQYFVKQYAMKEHHVPPGGPAVKVDIIFGRRILSTFLTTYLPTIILCVVSFSTNYFKPFFFEAIVTVNLTALLVLTTLFISISDSLPKTNYIKMIDIWLLFNLFVPFAEVIIHTYIDSLRQEEDRVINHHGKRVEAWSDEKIYPKSLVDRNEVNELKARQEFYDNAILVINPKKLKNALLMAKWGFPMIYSSFVLCFFAAGMANFYKSSVSD